MNLDFLDRLQLDKKKIIAILLVSLAIAVIDIGWVVNLQLKGLKAASVKVLKVNGELKTLEKDLALLQQNKLKPKASQKIKKIILRSDIPALIQDIDAVAKKHNVRIIQIKPAWSPGGKETKVTIGNLEQVFILLELNCGYHQFGSFINDLETLEKFMSVETMKIIPLGSDYLQQKVDLLLRTYVKK